MLIRNLQKTGGSSYTIILPKEWIKSLNLSEKDKLEIFYQKKDLLGIRPYLPAKNKKSTFYIGNLSNETITREIIALYIAGVSEIDIRLNKLRFETRSLIRKISYKLVGFEIFDSNADSILLKNVFKNTIPINEYISKMMKIIDSMFKDIKKVIINNERELAKDIIDRDIEVDRIELIAIREFNILLFSLMPETNSDIFLLEKRYYEHIAIRLERVADHIVRIANTVLQLEKNEFVNINKIDKDRISRTLKYFEECIEIVNNLDRNKSHDLLEFIDSRSKNEYINKQMLNTSSVNILIEDSLERIKSYIANIAEETINYNSIRVTTY